MRQPYRCIGLTTCCCVTSEPRAASFFISVASTRATPTARARSGAGAPGPAGRAGARSADGHREIHAQALVAVNGTVDVVGAVLQVDAQVRRLARLDHRRLLFLHARTIDLQGVDQ